MFAHLRENDRRSNKRRTLDAVDKGGALEETTHEDTDMVSSVTVRYKRGWDAHFWISGSCASMHC